VTLSPASGQTVTLNYSTADGSATAGSDYVATSGTLTFNPGDTTKTITVVVNGDTLNETNETFFVNLSSPVNATIADGQGLGTITNDDFTLPSISINDVSVSEGNTGTTNAVFTVTLSPASGQTVTLNYSTANGSATAGSDYVATSGTLTFNPGDTTKTITVVVNGDTIVEPDETFFVNLSNPVNATIADGQGLGTIINDDTFPPVSLSINDVSVTEGNTGTTNAVFTVTLSAASAQTVTVNYSTANGSATAGSDYVATSGTLTFNPGDTTKTITVVVNGDTVVEPNETFFVNLTTATNATIADGQGVGTILDDDGCTLLGAPPVDFDGDCKSDVGIYRDGAWTIIRSSDGGVENFNWGGASWIPVPADYDGDGIVDVAVYNANGLWSIVRSSDGVNTLIGWSGAAGDIPVPADYDGDGKADLAVYNTASAGWSIIRSSDGGLTYKAWGGPGWIPVPADYDGDGKVDIAVYNANGLWSIVRSSDGGNTLIGWSGAAGDIPVPADYDGDGKADFAVYNTATAGWSIIRSSDGGLMYRTWGGPGWEPVPADYDGDGKADIAVYNASNGLWSIVRSSDVVNTLVGLGGAAQDIPLSAQ